MAVGSWDGSFSFFHVDGLRVIKVRGARWPCGGEARESGVEGGEWQALASWLTLGLG